MFPRQQLISAFKWLVNYLGNRLTAGLPKSLYKPSNVTRGRVNTFTYKRSQQTDYSYNEPFHLCGYCTKALSVE